MRIAGLLLGPEAEGLPWRPTRLSGIAWIPLWTEAGEAAEGGAAAADAGRRRRGGAAVLIRMEPGRGYAPHRHVGSEDVLVLAGGYRDAEGTYRTGQHVHYAADSVHAPIALGDAQRPVGPDNPACVLFSVVPAGIELLHAPG